MNKYCEVCECDPCDCYDGCPPVPPVPKKAGYAYVLDYNEQVSKFNSIANFISSKLPV